MPGIEPGASYMQSMRSTTELHPRRMWCSQNRWRKRTVIRWAAADLVCYYLGGLLLLLTIEDVEKDSQDLPVRFFAHLSEGHICVHQVGSQLET